MTINSLLLHVSAEAYNPERGAAPYALGLAQAFKAHLQALTLELDVTTPRGAYARKITSDARAHIAARNVQAQDIAENLRIAAHEYGVEAQVITERSHAHSTPEIATDYGRLVDVIVAGVCDDGLLSERMVAETLIFQSGRPVIIVPTNHPPEYRADHILVAWDFSRVAARALSDAMPFLARAGQVTLVSFGDDKDFTSALNADAVVEALARRGVNARFLQAERGGKDIGEAIEGIAREQGADLLVMGGFGHSRFRDFVLGGATRSILTNPAIPTLISH